MIENNPVDNAILKAGSQIALAKLACVEQPSVAYWKRIGEIPEDKVRTILINDSQNRFTARELRPASAELYESS